jgi:Tfp pilus assembly protein PilX
MCNLKNKQQGNILVTTLLILITMNLMGVGLMHISTKEYSVSTYKVVDSQVLNIAQSCTYDVIKVFEALTAKPATVSSISVSNTTYKSWLTNLATTPTTKEQNKLSSYSYGCTVTYLTSKNVSSGTGVGTSVDSSGGEYGGTGGTTLRDYYQIVSTGQGPNNSVRVVNTIISVAY